MKLMTVLAVMVFVSMGCAASAAEKLPAFPGAEGFGAVAKGGRGGKVIKVTTLAAKGPGSFAEAAATGGPRIIVFDVSGVIRGNVLIHPGQCTIAGQTAPGAGITLEGVLRTKYPNGGDDIIIRFLRVRPRNRRGHVGDSIQMPRSDRVILDHCSTSWAVDESVDCIGAADWTMQWCTLEESDTKGHDKGRAHNYGFCSAYAGSGNLSLHHNLFAHHSKRSPCVAPYEPGKPADVRNNVMYDCYTALTHSGHGPKVKAPINMVGNWYKKGPSHPKLYPYATVAGPTYHISGEYIVGLGYIKDPADPTAKFPRWIQYNRNGKRLAKPAPAPKITTQKAEAAAKLVLAKAGCFPRDRVSKRTIEEVKTGGGKWGRNAPAAPTDEWFLKGLTVGKAPADADNDGMPDAWEKAKKLDPNDASDAVKIVPAGASKDDRHKGYTWIEYYINELADQLVAP
jgi:pectate lyase